MAAFLRPGIFREMSRGERSQYLKSFSRAGIVLKIAALTEGFRPLRAVRPACGSCLFRAICLVQLKACVHCDPPVAGIVTSGFGGSCELRSTLGIFGGMRDCARPKALWRKRQRFSPQLGRVYSWKMLGNPSDFTPCHVLECGIRMTV